MFLTIEKSNSVMRIRPNSGNFAGKVIALVEGGDQIGPSHNCRLQRPWGVTVINERAMTGDVVRALGLFPTVIRAASRRELAGV